MIKYITLIIVAFLMIGCGAKATSTKVNKDTTKQTVTNKVIDTKEVIEVKKEPKRVTLPEGFKETKKLRPLEANVPTTCQEWSDGCNTCTRAGNNQASCTVYTCENKAPFSCLKWQ
jgi:hypothetical protein